MAVLLLCSVGGAPGTTTTSLGLALQWPRPVVLVDADASAQQAITAGFLGGASSSLGMMSILHAQRVHAPIRERLLDHTQPLDDSGQARLLAGFTQPGASDIFTGWAELADELTSLEQRDMDVIVDAGRVTPRSLPTALLRRTDQVLLVARTSLRSLMALRTHLTELLDHIDASSATCQTGLALVGPDRPYSTAEITAQFGLPVLLQVPWAPLHAEVLSDAGDRPRRFDRSPFVTEIGRGAHRLHQRLTSHVRQRDGVERRSA